MGQMSLADICKHLKAAVIPRTPEDFVIAETFTLDLPDEELKAGIAAFRSFLHTLYDSLADNKDRFDVKTGKQSGTIPARFPIIEDLGAILFQIGFHGSLETEPRNELIIHGEDMLKVSKTQKYRHLNKLSKKRKMELFDFLSSLGFYFEDADFSDNVDFSKTGTFYVQYENGDGVLTGLKLMALAQANVKAKYDRYSLIIMRGDFYPLANAEPKPQTINITDYANTQPQEIKEWIVDLDRLLTETCKVDGKVQYSMCGGVFDYISRETKRLVCRVNILARKCSVVPCANHFEVSDDILSEFTEGMFDVMRSRNRACRACSEVNEAGFVRCMYGGKPYGFVYEGEEFELCRFGGLEFLLGCAEEMRVIRGWIGRLAL